MKPSAVSSGLVIMATKSPTFRPRRTRSSCDDTLRSTRTLDVLPVSGLGVDLVAKGVPAGLERRQHRPGDELVGVVGEKSAREHPWRTEPRRSRSGSAQDGHCPLACAPCSRWCPNAPPLRGRSSQIYPRVLRSALPDGSARMARRSHRTCRRSTASPRLCAPTGLESAAARAACRSSHARSASAIAAWPTVPPFGVVRNRVQPTAAA